MEDKLQINYKFQSNELRLLLELLKVEGKINLKTNQPRSLKDFNWDHFLELVKHHRCCPLVYSKLRNTHESLIPSYIIEELYQEYKRNTFKMLQLTGEMEQVDKLCTEKHITLLFLKGPTIAYDLFGDISLRMSKDLDILVLEKDLEKTEKILLSMGYEKREIPMVLNEIKWRHYHITYYHTQKKIQIEIHWRLHPRSMEGGNFKELWSRKRESSLTKHPISFMGKEDLLLYLISHGSRHGWFRLRWLKDIDQMVRSNNINYEHFNLLAIKYRQEHLVGQAFQLANLLLGTPLHEDIQKFVVTERATELAKKAIPYIEEMVQLNVDVKPRDLDKSYRNYLFSIKSKRQKLKFFVILFYPSSTDEQTLKLPKTIHFLYFLLRPFLIVWRKIRKPLFS
ncbi:nucleotidyltransferase family protein [Priestia sp. YIM B13489]|uniref:nucleotidyltransferase domain-containing protein n=1 Tax=Priestia sp. YIM B13489 TaxID=3366313 RepID=UPI003670A4ED